MAIKPAPGEVVEQQTRTRVIPAIAPDNQDKPWSRMDPFEYLQTLAPPEWEKTDVYLYRYNSARKKVAVEEYHQPITEWEIKRAHGGGEMCLMVKRNKMLIINHDFLIEGEPVIGGTVHGNGSNGNGSNDATSQIISMLRDELRAMREEMKTARGGDLGMEAVKQALTLNGQVFQSAAASAVGTLQHIASPGGTPAPNPMDDLNRQLMQAMIAKLLNPTDPIETFAKMAAAVKALPGFGGGVDNKAGVALELVRHIPSVASTLVQGIEHWRFAEEARARTAAISRSIPAAQTIPVTPIPQTPASAPSNVVEMPQAAAPGSSAEQPAIQGQIPADAIPGVQVPPIPIEALEQMIVNIICDPGLSYEQAANEACALIDRSMPGTLDKMAAAGEEQILQMFRSRPVLAQVSQHPRLIPFVQAIIQVVKNAPFAQPVNTAAPVA